MIVLGIDPGLTTGWAAYDTESRRVTAAGQFPEWNSDIAGNVRVDAVALERPRGQGPTYPQVVEAGIVFGELHRWARGKWPRCGWLYRYDVKRILTDATFGEIRVVNDKTCWQALKLLHGGDGSDKKSTKKSPQGGPIGGVSSHERAALAVAYAWSIREGLVTC